MMRVAIAAAVTVISASTAHAETDPREEALAIELMQRVLPKERFEQQGANALAELRAAKGTKDDPEVIARWNAMLLEVLPYDEVMRLAAKFLVARLNAVELEELLAFYKTPLGMKMATLAPEANRAASEMIAQRLANTAAKPDPPAPDPAALAAVTKLQPEGLYERLLDATIMHIGALDPEAAQDPQLRRTIEKAMPYRIYIAWAARYYGERLTPAELKELGERCSTPAWNKLYRATIDAVAESGKIAVRLAEERLPAAMAKHHIRAPVKEISCPNGQSGVDEQDSRFINLRATGCADARGRRQGVWKIRDESRVLSEDTYKDGELHGKRTFFPLGEDLGSEEQSWSRGTKHGPWTQYDGAGVKVWTQTYENGKAVATTYYDDQGQATASTSMPKRTIGYVIKTRVASFKYCYEKALTKDRSLAGKIKTEFFVESDGTVKIAKITESTLKNANVESCVLERVRKLEFPRQPGGRVLVRYPFVFSAS